MGLKNSRPLPLASAELEMAPFFKRRFRTWHLDHVALVVERYRALTSRHCIDALQLGEILGIKEPPLIDQIMRLFMPRTPTRVHHMTDAMEIVVALILVCQAPSMRHRFEAIFDVIDLNGVGVITPGDVVVLFGAFARTVMKLFCYTVEPDKRAAMVYIQSILEKGFPNAGSVEKMQLCKLMLTDQYAVHYTKQCTGEAKHKLYFLLEKDTEFLGAIEFHTEEQMKNASLKTIREMAHANVYKIPRDFIFLCQGREVQSVWEADRKAWAIVPFALRGSPGLRVLADSQNRRAECPRRCNVFEFRYMGNAIARYKKRVSDINPVYKHRGFKVTSTNNGKPLQCFVRWRVAENWSGEWVYGQSRIAAASKVLVQKRLRNAPRSETERVSVKNHQGQLISPSEKGEDVSLGTEGHIITSRAQTPEIPVGSIYKPEVLKQQRVIKDIRDKKIKMTARMIAMDALQQLDGANEAPTDDKENEPRRANRTSSLDASRQQNKDGRTTVLIQVHDGVHKPSRLLQSTTRRAASNIGAGSDSNGSSTRVRVSVLKQKLELQPSSTFSDGSIRLGPFMSASNIVLREDEVEVYPVIVIRPRTDLVDITAVEGKAAPSEADQSEVDAMARQPLHADGAYFSEYEFEVSAQESNFEHIYHRVHGTSTDLITLNRTDAIGRTLLHDAAEYGHSNLMELLLKVRVLRNIGDSRGDTPLHHAARHARLKEVSALLREGAAPWQANHEGKSALFCALEAAAKHMRQTAVSHKRPPPRWNASVRDASRDVEEKNFLATSDRYSRMRQVIDLLWDRYPVSIVTKPDNCDRASCLILEQQVYGDMFQACRDGNLLRVQRLVDLDKRASAQYINQELDMLGRTGLHEAAEQGHSAIVDLLLKLGADGYIADQRQQLPLHIAAEKGQDRIAKCLVYKFPGSVRAQDCVGKSPLHLAAERNHTAVALLLVSAMKDMQERDQVINLQDMHGYSALHYASEQANFSVCSALVDAGADVNVSYFEATVHSNQKHLLGVYDKHVGPVTSSQAIKPRNLANRGQVRFELDSAVETLLRSSKERTHRSQERIQILLLLVTKMLSSSRRESKRVKVYPPPLYHLAVEIADTNLAFAIDVCKALSSVKYEVNLIHHASTESALLHECKRVCQKKIAALNDTDSSDLALLRTLVQLGASVDLPNKQTGATPLACAAWYGHLAMLDLLLEAGAQRDFFPKNSFSPLHFAALGNHLACSKLLLGQNANINVHMQTPKHDEGPLFFAIRSKSEALVELFLSRGADPCAVCTLQRGVKLGFGIELAIEKTSKQTKKKIQRMPTFGPGKELIDNGSVTIASPLTFALLIARSASPFASQAESSGVSRAQKRSEWEALSRIAMTVARHAIAAKTPSGSAGSSLITRNDVYLACLLGYWELAKLLLTQQVVLPSAPTSSTMNGLHLAAAAGQSAVVTALVAAGMNVNCRLTGQGSHLQRGALYFALTHGHVETAARLLVLGAEPLDTLPYWHHKNGVRLAVHEAMPKAFKDAYFNQGVLQRPTESRLRDEYHPERVAINFVRHLEVSINAKIPVLHYAAAMGYTSLVKLLVEAGMSASTLSPPRGDASAQYWRREWYADTAIHVAVLCGQLDVVKYFASLVQFNFPRYFSREEKKPNSLLVAACTTKRLDILEYLLSSGAADDNGGGFNVLDTGEEVQRALNCCASSHFVDGFLALLAAKARADFFTLATAVEGITLSGQNQVPSAMDVEISPGIVETFPKKALASRRRDKRRILARTHELLSTITPFARHVDQFFKVLSFDHVLATFIICSQYGLWRVFFDVFIANENFFGEPLNPWKPILVRAASCCMVMHRAAMADQLDVLKFFVRVGVPADLRLSEMPALPCPIRYAATHESLKSFLFLALSAKDIGDSLNVAQYSVPEIHYRSITSSKSWFSPSSTCKWKNLSAMSCYEVPRTRQAANFIQAIIHLWGAETKMRAGNSLLHLACAHSHPALVQLLVEAGADLEGQNNAAETPLMVAAQRKDSFGVTIVRYLTAAMPRRTVEADEAARVSLISRALVSCYAQKPPCNLKTAKILFAAGADANYEDPISNPPGQSAIRHALETVQFAGVKLLLDNGAKLSLSLIESFLSQFQVIGDNRKSHWQRYSSYLKSHGQRLLEAESLMLILTEKKHASSCLNENLLHQLLLAAASIAATTAKQSGHEKRFWSVCERILGQQSEAVSSRKTVWGQKSALHYAVESLEVGIVQLLVKSCPFDIDAEDELKRTPLHLMAMNGDAGICQILLSNIQDKARIDCVDAKGRTPLHLAVIHGHEPVVTQLLRAGASLRVRCSRGYNAHLYAATLNRVAISMALFDKDASRDLYYASNGEFVVFLAARNAAFRVVRWIVSVFQESSSLFSLKCNQHERTLLQYAAIFGDDNLVKEILATGFAQSVLNAKDAAGYTALLYAFAFGRLGIVELLVEAGADANVSVDHSNEAKTHPYACRFSIASFGQWVVLPGWFSFVSTQMPAHEKRQLTTTPLEHEHYLFASGYHRRTIRGPVMATGRYARMLSTTQRNAVVRTTIRTWRFPKSSLFEFACEVGDGNVLKLLTRLHLPGTIPQMSYAVLRRAFLEAVQWNRIDIVDLLLSPTAGCIASNGDASTNDVQFADFLEVGIDRAISRGLEDMAIRLLSQWNGIKENGRNGADANAFAFQFAQAFQVACIRRLSRVVQYMITRGGEQIVTFHWNEGPSLVYAFAFGHTELATELLQHGAHISTIDTYVAPSFKKWIEFGCPKDVQVQWYELSAGRLAVQESKRDATERTFVGPLEEYEPVEDRLDAETMAQLFLPETFEAPDDEAAAGNMPLNETFDRGQ